MADGWKDGTIRLDCGKKSILLFFLLSARSSTDAIHPLKKIQKLVFLLYFRLCKNYDFVSKNSSLARSSNQTELILPHFPPSFSSNLNTLFSKARFLLSAPIEGRRKVFPPIISLWRKNVSPPEPFLDSGQ